MNERTTSSATSASSSARRTSRSAASTSASVSAPRRVRRSRIPPSRSDRLSNIDVSDPSRRVLRTRPQDEALQNTFAPEGASRCRAVASGLTGPVGGLHCGSCRERAETRDTPLGSQGFALLPGRAAIAAKEPAGLKPFVCRNSSPAAACLPDLPPSGRSRACSGCGRPRRATMTARCRTTSTASTSSTRTARRRRASRR